MNIYQQNIIDNYKHPQNFGILANPTIVAKRKNLSCGDEIIIYLLIESNIIKDIKFEGSGCALSIASASIMSEYFIGRNLEEIDNFDFETFRKDHLGIDINPSRMNCALIFIDAIKSSNVIPTL